MNKPEMHQNYWTIAIITGVFTPSLKIWHGAEADEMAFKNKLVFENQEDVQLAIIAIQGILQNFIKGHGVYFKNKEVSFAYTNYKGLVSMRRVMPIEILFGSNEWHPEPQWLLRASDLEKQQERIFAIKDIQLWTPLEE